MAKKQYGHDPKTGEFGHQSGGRRGDPNRSMTIKENVPAKLAKGALKAAGGAIKKSVTSRRWG